MVAERTVEPASARALPHALPRAGAGPLGPLVPTSAGQSLDPVTRQAMSARLGYDFGRVRVHNDEAAAGLADSVRARAYTIGHDVVFAAGQYRPTTPAGQALLTHELQHVVQQATTGVRAVQRDDVTKPPPVAPTDPELVLGQRLVKDFSTGIALAFYAPMPFDKERAMGAAQAWALREQALGIRGKAVTVKNAAFGVAMSDDDHPLVATIQAIGTLLNTAVGKAAPGTQLPGMGPTTVRTLAIFAHGTTDWCGLGAITSSKAASIIKSIAPNLATGVNVILFSCNSGRGGDEVEEWHGGVMHEGGVKSLAGQTRDALVAEGKTGGTVWGHTVTGDVSTNYALREFDASAGKGTPGASFTQRYAFGPLDQALVAAQLLDGVVDGGYQPTNEVRLRAAASLEAERELYRGNDRANANLTYPAGGKLAESAPTHPVEVGKLIKKYWDDTHWPARKATAVQAFVKDMLARGLIKKRPVNAVP